MIENLYLSEDIRKIERTYADLNNKCYDLMVSAGIALYKHIKNIIDFDSNIAIVCGPGNNGGDGYELAYNLVKNGYTTTCFCYSCPKENTEAENAYKKFLSIDGKIIFEDELPILENFDVIVDGLLGIGIKTNINSRMEKWIKIINSSTSYIVAIDVPSGLDSNNGFIWGTCIKANLTINLLKAKLGCFTGKAKDFVGKVIFDDIGVKENTVYSCVKRYSYKSIKNKLTLLERNQSSHKGDSGKLLLIGGGIGMPGAIKLATEASLRTGVGLAKVACRKENFSMIFASRPEIMFVEPSNVNQVLSWTDAIVLGPGLGRDEWSYSVWKNCIDTDLYKLVDADGLFWLAKEPRILKNAIITPHNAEAARLLNVSVEYVERNRYNTLVELHKKYGAIIVLKGPGTLITDGNQIFNCANGCSGMAVGGMGDVLSGIIGALLASKKISILDCAKFAVAIHGRSAELNCYNGTIGLLPSDLMDSIRSLVNRLEN